MIRDFKSRSELNSLNDSRNTPRYRIIALFSVALCGSALLFSYPNSSDSALVETADEAVTETQTITVAEPEPVSTKPEFKEVALALPGHTSEQTHNREVTEQALAEPISDAVLEIIAIQKTAEAEPLLPLAPTAAGQEPLAVETTAITPAPNSASEQPAQEADESAIEIAKLEQQPTPEIPAVEPVEDQWLETKVKNGDSLARIFSRLELSPNLLHRIVHSSKEAKQLAKIRPGQTIRVRQTTDGEFLELVHKKSAVRSVRILPENDSFVTKIIDRDLEKRVAQSSGIITSSLFVDATKAGLSDSLTMELANIFGWDIDFALEIRAGDHFSLIYEEEYLDGKKFRNGPILAAEFVNQGKVFRAIRYEDEDGYGSYFSPDGKSMRKAFLRAPVDFRRISSRFTRARWHPVLGKKRPHKGVDYAAKTGTPIKAAGDGRVVYRGKKGGYGRTIIVQHGQKYTTLYAHMSKYRGKVKNGSRVKQGQVIGYVGKSGLATGPHLHYEFRVNGVHRNPLTVKLPAAEPIAKKYRDDFKAKSATLLSQLDSISSTLVAEADTSN